MSGSVLTGVVVVVALPDEILTKLLNSGSANSRYLLWGKQKAPKSGGQSSHRVRKDATSLPPSQALLHIRRKRPRPISPLKTVVRAAEVKVPATDL
jgi:hypothetical protein